MKNIVEDKIFSKNLLELSTLKESKIVTNSYSDEIFKAHGGLLELSNKNILFDLRSYSYKPVFGHNHPLAIRYKNELLLKLKEYAIDKVNLPIVYPKELLDKDFKFQKNLIYKNLFFTNSKSLINKSLTNDYYFNFFLDGNEYIVSNKIAEAKVFQLFQNYLNVVLISGLRLQVIQEKIKDIIKDTNIVSIGNLLFLDNPRGLAKEDLIQYNILTNDENFEEKNILLYIPISMTNDQLDFLLSRIIMINKAH